MSNKTADKQRFTYEYVTAFLKKRGITLLSKTYKNTFSPIDYTPTTVQFLTGYLCRKCWLNKTRVPVVAFPLTSKCQMQGEKNGQVFDSIEQAAKAIQANPNNVRIVAKGRKQTCKGYGIVQVTREQAQAFKKSPKILREFCKLVTFQTVAERTARE